MSYFWSMFRMFTKVLKGTKDGLLITFIKWQCGEWDTLDTITNFNQCTVELLIMVNKDSGYFLLLTAAAANETALKGSEDPSSSGNMLPSALELP